MIYEGADQAIRDMNRYNLKRFTRMKLAKFDEANVIRAVKSVWEDSVRYAVTRFEEIAVEAYIVAQYRAGVDKVQATKNGQKKIRHGWILEYLEEINAVTYYRFMAESERKMYRLIEAIVASNSPRAEIDKALKAWSRQLAQYADLIVDAATIAGYKDAGVPKLMWNTEKDDRVCKECEALDGQVFEIDEYPAKKHPNCRCWPSIAPD